MNILEQYQLYPSRGALSGTIKDHQGPDRRYLKLIHSFGLISKKDLEVLIAIRQGSELDLSNAELETVIESLKNRGLIIKRDEMVALRIERERDESEGSKSSYLWLEIIQPLNKNYNYF